MRTLLATVLVLSGAPAAQESANPFHVHADDPLHRVAELQLGTDGALVEGMADFDGTLYVWVRSNEIDPVLAVVVGTRDAKADDDSGGGTTASLRLTVEPGEPVTMAVHAVDGSAGAAELHWLACPETDETRAAVERAKALLANAEAAEAEKDFERARAIVAEAIDVLRGARGREQSSRITELAWRSGFVADRLGAIDACWVAWNLTLAARERALPEDHPDLLAARLNLASMMRMRGDLVGARALAERVLAARERLLHGDHPDLVRARQNLASMMFEQGDLAGARSLFERVLRSRERTLLADHPDLLAARRNLAATLAEQGDLAGARAIEERALADAERTLPADHPDLLDARQNLAVTMLAQGELAGARMLTESVLAAQQRTLPHDHPDLIRARQNLAILMYAQGDTAGARALGEQVLAAYERTLPEDHPHLVAARQNLASTMAEQGDLAAARALFERTLSAFERALPEDHPHVQVARRNLAATMAAQGDLAGAQALEERALEAYERSLPEDHPQLLAARQNLAVTMYEQGDLAGARAVQEGLLAACERAWPDDHPQLLVVRQNLANMMAKRGDLAGARALLEHALAGCERTLSDDHPGLLDARQNLAVTMAEQGDPAGAHTLVLDLASGMLAGVEIAATSFSRREADALVGAYAHKHSVVRCLSASGESRLRFDLNETLRGASSRDLLSGVSRTPPSLTALRERLLLVRGRIGDLLADPLRDGTRKGGLQGEIESLTAERDKLERRLLAEQGRTTAAIRSADVARALLDAEVAIGFLRVHDLSGHFEDEPTCRGDVVAAHVLRPNGAIVEVELAAAEELQELVEGWRSVLGAPLQRGIGRTTPGFDRERNAGEALRARLLDPLLAELGEETTTLLVCAADLVHAVPLEALPLGDGRVGDRYRVVNQLSFRRLVASHPLPDTPAPELLALGGAAFDAQGAGPAQAVDAGSAVIEAGERGSGQPTRFEPLFFTGAEAERVKLLFEAVELRRGTVLTGENATKAAFHEHAPGKRFVHVATHGWFAEMQLEEPHESEPLSLRRNLDERVRAFSPLSYCGLALAGANRGRDSLGRVPGIMTAEELAGVDLSQCELAVLSACETNVGIRSAGMGIESLQAALHAAGARTAITSLWKVDDAATRKLMELFYTYLWIEELPKAEALWKAKCDLRAAGAPVSQWAAWVLSGDPN